MGACAQHFEALFVYFGMREQIKTRHCMQISTLFLKAEGWSVTWLFKSHGTTRQANKKNDSRILRILRVLGCHFLTFIFHIQVLGKTTILLRWVGLGGEK